MRALILGAEERAAIKKVVDYAEANRIDVHRLWRMVKGQEKPPADLPGYACLVPVGYRCVFSIDQEPGGWMRHLSVSVDRKGSWPNDAAVAALAHEFGFAHTMKERKWSMHLEKEYQAVNILEPL